MFEAVFTKNEVDKTLTVERQFAAEKNRVWQAWTDDKMLEKWWGPEPFKAVSKSFSFTEGGKWHYYMAGPNGEKHWAMMVYESIHPQEYFTALDAFADENGSPATNMPTATFKVEFTEKDGQTRVKTTITFSSLEDMNKLIEMGMAEGTAMGYRQLDALLA